MSHRDSQSLPTVGLEAEKETAEDRARRRQVLADSREFLLHFGSLVRQLLVHDPTNQAVRQVLDNVVADVERLRAEHGGLSIVFAEGHTFANGVWVRATGRAWEAAVFLTETLEKRNARGFVIDPSCRMGDILAFTLRVREWSKAREKLPERDADIGVQGVRLLPVLDREAGDNERAVFRQMAVEVFQEGLLTVRREAASRLDLFMRRRQRSLILRLVQMVEESPEDALILTTLRDPTLPPTAHNLLVAILSICLGRILDLRRRDLVRLGVVALNHNVGEALVPSEIFSPERELSAEERRRVEMHPLLGMRHLLEHFGFDVPIVERAIVSAEHHLHYDGGGYPVAGLDEPHLFSRIVSVCDVFAAMSDDRPWREMFPPDQAMKLIGRESATKLDPVLVRAFVRLVGRFPPGSLVELDTGEYAVVLGPGKGLDPLQRPRVLLLTDEDGYELDDFLVVDLGERHTRRRAWLRTVVRTRDPRRLGRPVSAYLFADREVREPERLDSEDEALARARTARLERGGA